MQVSRKTTIEVTTSYKDLTAALKAYYPDQIDVQALPDAIKAGVNVVISSGKGVQITWEGPDRWIDGPGDVFRHKG